MTNNHSISIAIMTKNEADNIAACIESALWADEVLILDCGSTDNTIEICKKYPVKILNTDWPGFGEQSNHALNTVTYEWCFLLDADERITEELKQEILITINSNSVHKAYQIPRLNFFMGKALRYSLNPNSDLPVKLLKKGSAQFQHGVHPKPIVDGTTGKLKKYLLHYPFKNLTEILNKANYYSSLGATKLEGHTKPSFLKALLHAKWVFIKIYILKLGFLDGWPGFIIALSNFEGTFYKYAKLVENKSIKP